MKYPKALRMRAKQCLSLSTALILAIPTGSVFAQGALEEIIITAARRAESLQDSSLIIEAFGSDTLYEEGVTNAVELTRLVPSLQVGLAGPQLQVYMRGVGTPTATIIGSPAIAINKNGQYLSRTQSAGSSFYDLERVEVLKGPQGTLYGRNATGGAVNLITKGPDLDEFGGYASVDFGNYSKKQFEGAVNMPISDTFALRASTFIIDRDGYMDDGTMADEHWSGRLQSLWEPSENVSWRLEGQYSDYDAPIAGFTYFGADDPWESTISDGANAILAANASTFPSAAFPWINTAPIVPGAMIPPGVNPAFPDGSTFFYGVDFFEDDSFQELTVWDISSTLTWDTDFATVTWLASYQDMESSFTNYPGPNFSQLNPITGEPETSESFTSELRLSNETDNWKWVAGVNIWEEDQYSPTVVDQGAQQSLWVDTAQESESFGIFGDVVYSLSDELRLEVGLRYSEDEITHDFSRFALSDSLTCAPFFGNAQTENGVTFCTTSARDIRNADFDSTDWKVGVEYDLSDDSMLFASVGTGYKAGGFSNTDSIAFEPEELTAYELGFRNLFMDGRLQLNGDIFFWEYENRQESQVGSDLSGIIGQTIVNAGESEIKGFGVDIVFAATENDRIRFAAEYLDAEYTDFTFLQGESFTNGVCPTTPTGNMVAAPGPPGSMTPELLVDCTGFESTRSPELSGNASYVHTFDLENGSLDANLNASYKDQVWTTANFLAAQRVPDLLTINASLTYNSADGQYTVVGYINNIDEDATFSAGLNHTQVPELVGFSPTPPRTYGVRVRYNF